MKIVVTGATGFIGNALCESLIGEGHQLVLLVRNPEKAKEAFPRAHVIAWEASGAPPAAVLEGAHAVVHLAGESIAAGRWTKKRRKAIRDSRVMGTRYLVDALALCLHRPGVLVSSSAVGYYGDQRDEILDESSPPGSDFLASVCKEWEAEATRADSLGIRVVQIRTGLVLSPKGGALPRMLPPFKAFVGGPVGNGRQWMSWIHLEDEVGAIRHVIDNESMRGPVNCTAPHPVSNREFSRTLGKVLKRPAFMPVPAFVLRLVLGEMAQGLLLQGQRVLPRRLEASGYSFRFPRLTEALQDLLT